MKIRVEKKHPLALRWNHWINFPVLMIMIWSGLMIYWAFPAFGLPGEWLEYFGWGGRLGEGLGWHFTFAYVFALNGLLYLFFLFFSGQWRYLLPDRRSLRDAALVTLHDFRIYRGPLPAQRKYNGAQRITYTSILILGALEVITGFAIYKPTQLSWLVNLLGGFEAAKLEHFIIMILFVLFFIVHLIQVLRSGWNNFRAMITGLERKDVE